MAKYARKICRGCGKDHFGPGDVCSTCQWDVIKGINTKTCALCDAPIKPGLRMGNGHYCSTDCAYAVGDARARVIYRVKKAVASGEIKPATDYLCADCGAQATMYDHRRYMEPLAVTPVCRSCNFNRGAAEDVKELVAANQKKVARG